MPGQTAAVTATAGRGAAAMAKQFADRYAGRQPGRPLSPRAQRLTAPEFAARLLAERRLVLRPDTLPGRVADLISGYGRNVFPPGRPTPARTRPALIHPPAAQPGRGLSPAGSLRPWKASPRDVRTFRPMAVGHAAAPALTAPAAHLTHPAFPTPAPAGGPVQPVRRRRDAHEPPHPRPIAGQPPAREPSPAFAAAAAAPTQPDRDGDYGALSPTVLRDTLRRQGGPGTFVEYALRERLRGPLRFDPAQARLHHGPAAAAAARALRAEAFTIGTDVFFGAERFQPSTTPGLALLAHELTHVGQQAARAASQMRFFTPSGGDALEEEAQQGAARFLQQEQATSRPQSSGVVQRKTAPSMEYAMPPARPGGVEAVAMTAPQQRPSAPAATSSPDSQAVADRVYDLMRADALRDRQRGLRR